MTSARQMWDGLSSVRYRDLLNGPGVARAHDLQRLASYGLGITVGLIVEMETWRTNVVLAITGVLFAAALLRLVTNRNTPPYVLALTDLLLSGVAVAVATASPVITIAVVVSISGAIAASFRANTSLAIWMSLTASLPGVVASFALGTEASAGIADYLSAIVLISLMLTLTAFILGFFAIQTRQLRQQLTYQEHQLNAVLAVTPVVLAAVSSDRVVTTLAGDIGWWQDLSGQQLPETSAISELVEGTVGGERTTADITLGDRIFTVTCDPATDGGALLTAYDVTQRTEARRRLEEVVRAKDQFIAAVSHELRTPLASVLGFSELVQERMDDVDPLQPMMTEVTDQSAEMAAIIDDLLVAARASFESVPLMPRMISLVDETSAVIDSIGSRLRITPERSLVDIEAFADPIRVRQIIRNLLTNADRYGGDCVRVETDAADGFATLVVKDSGNPLPAERREQIFQPYESSGPVRGQPAAIGLGLAVSRTLAELMGGTITYNHDGEWSEFKLRLPAHEPAQIENEHTARLQVTT